MHHSQNNTFLIAIGGNLPSAEGPPEATLRAAISRISQSGLEIHAISKFYRTPAFPVESDPEYVNAALSIFSCDAASQVLCTLHRIEADFGRERIQRWGQRTLDLDIIAHGSRILPDLATYAAWQALAPSAQTHCTPAELILPHPRLQDRAFVLVPMADIAPEWHHPVLGLSVAEMLARLPAADRAAVRRIDPA